MAFPMHRLDMRTGHAAKHDTVLDITWRADANDAQTSGFDVDGLIKTVMLLLSPSPPAWC